jgi:hypothetical protein
MKDDFTNKPEIVGESEKPDIFELDNEIHKDHYVITVDKWIFWLFVIIFVSNCNHS